jgi:salicylate hydroxylase
MYSDIDEKLAQLAGIEYTDNYVSGLPIGLELPTGVTIGAKL